MDTDRTSDPILELDGVVAGYGRMTILNGTTFRVPRGAITTVIGPNGAGKSTVFKTVFGLLAARSGIIRFEGRDITNWSPRRVLEAGICYVPQGRNIFPELSVRHNIELGGVAAGSGITDLPARIEAALDRFPVLRRKADRQASTLSGGEQKQLEIVRGLLLDPKLVLIDEPSIGLSPLMVQETFGSLPNCATVASPFSWSSRMRARPWRCRITASCWNSARRAWSTPPPPFSPTGASASSFSAARWRTLRGRFLPRLDETCARNGLPKAIEIARAFAPEDRNEGQPNATCNPSVQPFLYAICR